ncbi:protein kinase domain-containing protein [Brumimicrobium oceani]|uniref:protein kinase domain-containing protein n=1 Tax=Brumimicrobium oceani TaxID=2100725 RepID=UPI001304AE45|nr:hypothetical protein [Brumimicrobium oceani]
MKREIHTLIIWSASSEIRPKVDKLLNQSFKVLKEYTCNWSEKNFEKNLMSFYAHSQMGKNIIEYKKILRQKAHHCGMGEFYLFVLEDEKPIYELRDTSSGKRNVNINLFDLKSALREQTGGGFRIHASDNTFESNKDLTILLGKNTNDFLNNADFSAQKESLNTNCLGTDGFKSIEEFFYLLNNSIDYVVLRNYEYLPKEYTLEEHDDIDLLVENLNFIRYLTHATPVYPNSDNRVYFNIKIANENIPFDFRHIGDNYYDLYWQNNILKNKLTYNKLINVPNQEDYFYTLLYHAYVQKKEIKEDYYPKLEKLAVSLGINYTRLMAISDVKTLLDRFLVKNGYKYTIPNDNSVIFNYTFSKSDINTDSYGKRLSSMLVRQDDHVYFTEVFYNQESNSIYKLCSSYLGNNENRFLKLLEKDNIAPKVISYKDDGKNTTVEMTFIDGIGLNQLNSFRFFWRKKNINIVLENAFHVLKVLHQHEIEHRDIKPDNLILINDKNQYKLKVIDFAWSKLKNEKNSITPEILNGRFCNKDGDHSDVFSMQETLLFVYDGFPTIKKYIIEQFSNLDLANNKTSIQEKKLNLTIVEKVKWMMKNYPKLDKALHEWYYKLRKG